MPITMESTNQLHYASEARIFMHNLSNVPFPSEVKSLSRKANVKTGSNILLMGIQLQQGEELV